MKALVYQGPGRKALEDRPIPEIATASDAIVRIAKTTICGTDLHNQRRCPHLPPWTHPRSRGNRNR
jgi:threonine dehydrogenase-like Zn-dependent dehydrogenase